VFVRPSHALALAILTVACGNDAATAPATTERAEAVVISETLSAISSVDPLLMDAVIADLLTRVVPALGDSEAAAALRTSIEVVSDANGRGELSEVRRSLMRAEKALAAYRKTNAGEQAAAIDVDVISQSLQRLDAILEEAGVAK
jgi:hypothetical protein